MTTPIAADSRTVFAGASSASSRSSQSASGGTNFADILVSTTGAGGPAEAAADGQATAAAANAAANDVSMLAQLTGAFRNGAPNGTLSVATIDRSGRAIAGASLDTNGDLSVFGSGSSGAVSSTVTMSLPSQADGGTWYAHASAEIAQASYELNSLISQSTAASNNPGVDRAA
jgi:hypothetical protein